MGLNLKIDNHILQAKLKDLARVEAAVAPLVYQYFKAITPIRSGNARAHTVLKGKTIEAEYPYAYKLDDGYSQQAPNGMTEPTKEYAKKVTQDWIKQHGAKK